MLGGRERASFALRDFSAYYRTARDRFVETPGDPARDTYPEPCEHCAVCRWQSVCEARRSADDHLSLVAGLAREQGRKLAERADIHTVAELAASPDGQRVRGIGDSALERLRRQARLQARARALPEEAPPPYELLPPESDRGLSPMGRIFFHTIGSQLPLHQ